MNYQQFLMWVFKRAESISNLDPAYTSTLAGWLRVGHIEATDVEIRVIQLVFAALSHKGVPTFTLIGSQEVMSKKAASKELSDMAKAGYKIRRWRFGMSDLVAQPDLKRLLVSMERPAVE
jgi:hypothetical protein